MRIQETLAGGKKIRRPISGRYLLVKAATAEIIITGQGLGEVFLGSGESYDLGSSGSHFIEIENSSAASNTFLLEVTEQSLRKANSNELTVNTEATIQIGNDNQHLPKVSIPANSAAQIAGANPLRKSLRVSLKSDAAGYVLLGKSGLTAGNGGSLEEGMVDYVETTGAMFAFNPNAVAVDVYVMEVNRI